MTNYVTEIDEPRHSAAGASARATAILNMIGIETLQQLAVTLCVLTLVVVTTLGNSGGASWVYLTYRTDLLVIAVLCAIASRKEPEAIKPVFLAGTALALGLMLVSVLRIPGSHFEALYLWYKYAFFAAAFLSFAKRV